MLTNFFAKNAFDAAANPAVEQVAFFVSRNSSWRCWFNGYNPRGRRNFTAMRDQNFQELMSKFDHSLLDDGPGNVSKNQQTYPVGETKPTIIEELDSQLPFKQFLKRSLPNRKPSSEFIQSIKDRIKIIETPNNSI